MRTPCASEAPSLLDHMHARDHATANRMRRGRSVQSVVVEYHLRALAKWGFRREAESGAGPRSAVGELPPESNSGPTPSQPCSATSSSAVQQQRRRNALRREHVLPPALAACGAGRRTRPIVLTASELEELGARFEECSTSFGAEASGGTRQVVISSARSPSRDLQCRRDRRDGCLRRAGLCS